MSNADVSRAANSAVDAASAGLDKYFSTLQERVISLLAEDRGYLTKSLESVHTILGAVANEQHEIRAEGKRDRGELLAGVHGLSQEVSIMAASVQELTAQLQKHDNEIASLQSWRIGVDERLRGVEQFDRDALLTRIERIDLIIADLPTQREHDPDALIEAVIERLERRGRTRGAGGKGAKKDGE